MIKRGRVKGAGGGTIQSKVLHTPVVGSAQEEELQVAADWKCGEERQSEVLGDLNKRRHGPTIAGDLTRSRLQIKGRDGRCA
jgi:hypothetical protein